MLHQPSGGAQGMASDIAIVAEDIIKTKVGVWCCNADITEHFFLFINTAGATDD